MPPFVIFGTSKCLKKRNCWKINRSITSMSKLSLPLSLSHPHISFSLSLSLILISLSHSLSLFLTHKSFYHSFSNMSSSLMPLPLSIFRSLSLSDFPLLRCLYIRFILYLPMLLLYTVCVRLYFSTKVQCDQIKIAKCQ